MEKVEFLLGQSHLLLYFSLSVYAGSFLIVGYCAIPLIFKILVVALLFFRFSHLMKLHINRTAKNAIVRVWQEPTLHRWGYQTKRGLAALGTLQGDSYHSSICIILRLRLRNRVQTVFIPRDALPFREFHYLRMRLKSA